MELITTKNNMLVLKFKKIKPYKFQRHQTPWTTAGWNHGHKWIGLFPDLRLLVCAVIAAELRDHTSGFSPDWRALANTSSGCRRDFFSFFICLHSRVYCHSSPKAQLSSLYSLHLPPFLTLSASDLCSMEFIHPFF